MKLILLIILLSVSFLNCNEAFFIQNQGQINSDILYYTQYKGLNLFLKEDGIYYDFYEEINRNENTITKKGHIVKLDFDNSNIESFEVLDNPTIFNFFRGNDNSKWFNNVKTVKEIILNNIYENIDLRVYFDKNMPRYDIIINPNSDPTKIRFNFKSSFNSIVEDDKIKTFINVGDFESSELFAYQLIDNKKIQVKCSFEENTDGSIKFKIGEYDKSKQLVIDPIIYTSLLNWFGDDYIKSIDAIDNYNYYVAGVTSSPDFPSTLGAYQNEFALGDDIFIAKYFKKGTENILQIATFFGGSDNEILSKIIYKNNKVYFGGSTKSGDFPNKNFLNNKYKGNQDGFVAVLNDSLNKLEYAYFIGGSEVDGINDIAISNGKVFFGGYSNSNDLQITGAFQGTKNGGYDCIFGASRENGTSFEFLTYLGGSLDDKANGIDVDDLEYLYWIATTESADFITYPRGGFGSQNKAFDTDFNGGSDIMLGRFSAAGGTLQLSSYYGGLYNDYGVDVIANSSKNYYFLGYSEKEENQTVPIKDGLIQKNNAGGKDIVFGRMSDIISVKIGLSSFYETQDLEIATFVGGNNDDIPTGFSRSKDGQSFFITGYTNSINFPQVNDEIKTPRLEGNYDAYFCEINNFGSKISYSSYLGGKEDDRINASCYLPNGNFIYGGETLSDNFPLKGFNINQTRNSLDAFIAMSNNGMFSMNAPNGGNSYCPNSPLTSVWSRTDFEEGDGFNIHLINNKLNIKELIGSNIKGNLYNWIIPNSIIADSNYKVLIEHPNGFFALSKESFIINQIPKINEFITDNSNLCVGDSMILSAKVSGAYYPKFIWKFNNNIILNTDTNSIVIKDLNTINTGTYSLNIKGECDPVAKSQELKIDVSPLTSIGSKSEDVEILKGKELELQVDAFGGDLTYQWKLNNNILIGQKNSKLKISSVDIADEGDYTCLVSGRCGESVTSEPINVKVTTTNSILNSHLFDIFYYDGNNINIELKLNYSGLAVIKIIDITGKEVMDNSLILAQGTNKLEIPVDFENGTYLLTIISNQKVVSNKFAIIK